MHVHSAAPRRTRARAEGRVGRARPPRLGARLGAQLLTLVVLAGGMVAVAGMHKVVTIDVDGSVVTVDGYGRTVGQVLAAADVRHGEGDLVVPAPATTIGDGGEVVVRHGREIEVEVDGELRRVWSTALTAGEAADELSQWGEPRLSASRSAPLVRGAVLRVSTSKSVSVLVDGEVIDLQTSAPTVREALLEVGLVLGEHDTLSVPLDASAVDGLAILVTRAVSESGTVTEAVPFAEREVEDDALASGTVRVRTKGKVGTRQVVYRAVVVGGVEVGREEIASVVLAKPVDQVVVRGTMEIPDVPSVTPGTAQALAKKMAASRGWGDDEFACLHSLWKKESGWRVNAHNKSSGAYGIPQAMPGKKMASVGSDWRTSAKTQITWGLGYIKNRYGTPCDAWAHSERRGWY